MGDHELVTMFLQRAVQKIHWRLADEAGNPFVDRMIVDFLWRAELLQHAVVHDGDAVRHRQCLELIMGHIDHGRAQLALHDLELAPHVGTQLGIEMRDRLIEQEQLGLAHDRPPDGGPLFLAAGEFTRTAL